MTFTQKQALKIWNAMIYEEPIFPDSADVQGATRPTPFTILAAWLDVPTVYLNQTPGYADYMHQVAAFLREVSDGLEEYHGK